MRKLTLRDLSLKNQRVLMRVDFNVPLSKNGEIADDSRIKASLSSIDYILKNGGILILMSHLGRPEGKPDPKFSLKICGERLSQLLGKPVQMAPDCIGPAVKKQVNSLKRGDVLLLENLRFHPGEETPEKEPSFVRELASNGDLYVNDAFGSAHRSHASTALIASYFPQKAAAGFLMEKEISELSFLLQNPKKPFYAIAGGAKISTKIGVIKHLLNFVDALFLGGAMVYPFFKAKKIEMGDFPLEDSEIESAREILSLAQEKNFPLYLPLDLVIAQKFSNDSPKKIIDVQAGIPRGWQGMDIGPKTIASWSLTLKKGKTIFWNGPLGVFEMPEFAKGTEAIAKILAHSDAKTIVGGGDSVAAIQQMGLEGDFTHLSTGGGASLEFLEFGHLPGIDALSSI